MLASKVLFDTLEKTKAKEKWEIEWEKRIKREWEKYLKEKEREKPKEEWEKIWKKLEKKAIAPAETEEELYLKRIYAARSADAEKLEDILRDLTEIKEKIKQKPIRTRAEKEAKAKAFAEMGIIPEWAFAHPLSAGTELGVRVLTDATARCMHESLKLGDALGDIYIFLRRAKREREAKWKVKALAKAESLRKEKEKVSVEKAKTYIYDTCGVLLPPSTLLPEKYDEYLNELKRRYKSKERDLKKIREKTRSRFSYASVPRCGLYTLELVKKISEIQSLILSGEAGLKPYPDKYLIEEILSRISAEEVPERKIKPKVTLETILRRIEREACVCGDFLKKNKKLIDEIKEKIKRGERADIIMQDLEELKERFGECLTGKMLPVKTVIRKPEKEELVVLVNSRVMTDLINKWGADVAAQEFYTDQKIMEILANGFGKTFETPP